MEFKLIRTSDYVKPLKENFSNILNEKYMKKLFYKDEKEVYIKINNLEDLIEFKNSIKHDIIIGIEDTNKVMVINNLLKDSTKFKNSIKHNKNKVMLIEIYDD